MEVEVIKTRRDALAKGLVELQQRYNNAIIKQQGAIEECDFWIERLEKEAETKEETEESANDN